MTYYFPGTFNTARYNYSRYNDESGSGPIIDTLENTAYIDKQRNKTAYIDKQKNNIVYIDKQRNFEVEL